MTDPGALAVELEGLKERLRERALQRSAAMNMAYDRHGMDNTPETADPLSCEAADAIDTLLAALKAQREALEQIRDLEAEGFEFPADWSDQIAACPECKRYEGHPIQQGICDTHRKPLWARERHDNDEEKRLGYRAKQIARAALSSTQGGEA